MAKLITLEHFKSLADKINELLSEVAGKARPGYINSGTDFSKILADNSWTAGQMWLITKDMDEQWPFGEKGNPGKSFSKGYMVVAIEDHPADTVNASDAWKYFRVIVTTD